MEAKTTPSLYGDRDDERGVGGKLGKAQARKRPATPYDRPPVNLASRGAGGWWSKLGDPAYRLVSGATKMILPSFLNKSHALLHSTGTKSKDKLDAEVIPNAKVDDPCTSSYEAPKFTGRTEPSEVASERLKTTCESESSGQDKPKNTNDDPQLSRIEQLIKGKTFSGDEIKRLTEILNSKVCTPSEIDGGKANQVTTTLERTARVNLTPFPRMSDEQNQDDGSRAIMRTPKPALYPNAHAEDDAGVSPVDIAKAYMGNRMSEPGAGSHNALSKGETAMQPNDEFVLKPFTPSHSHKASTCWPGAVVQDPHGYLTPSQRGRYGLHDFPRTPYSRTIYSKSRSKLTQLKTDSIHQITSSKAFPQFPSPVFGQVKSRNNVLDDSYGSVGPIRHVRNKFASEARTRGSILLRPSKDASSPFQQPSVSEGFPPMLEKDLESGKTSKWPGDHYSGNRFGESVPLLNPSSSQAVKKILEQLDRNKPTPNEKAAELKLATSWRESPGEDSLTIQKENTILQDSEKFGSFKSTDSVEPKLLSEGNKSESNSSQVKFQKRSVEAEDAVVKSPKTSGTVIGDSGTTNVVSARTSFPQMKSFQQEASVGLNNLAKEIGSNSSLSKSNGQHVITASTVSHFEPSKKVIPPSCGTKPVLSHISVGRRDPNRTVNFENGAGFSFPVSSSSSVLSEPPTPSFMPFSSSSLASHSKEVPTVPAYSFGTEKSASRLVFSFPSTSSAHVDALDPKFTFGSEKKPRLSFASVGKDAICY